MPRMAPFFAQLKVGKKLLTNAHHFAQNKCAPNCPRLGNILLKINGKQVSHKWEAQCHIFFEKNGKKTEGIATI